MGTKHLSKVISGFLSAGLLTVVALSATSCTRELPTANTSVVFDVPTHRKSSTLAVDDELGHIILNVTGPGIATPQFMSWDGEKGGAAPSTFTVEVLTGSARLFQILLVYENTSTGVMSFYYGDVLQDVTTSTDSITVPTAILPTTVEGDGQISGRMLKAAGVGYTGKVAMRFPPGNGRPPMLIEKAEVFGGWFSFFGLDGIAFSYVDENGVEFFGAPLDIGTNSFGADARSVAVTVPDHWESRGSSDPREPRPGSINVFGWFGDAASITSNKICYYSGSVGIPYAYTSSSTGDNTTITWDDSLIGTGGGVADSGTPAADGLCTATGTTPFVDLLRLAPKDVTHKDTALGIRGPFRRHDYTNPGGGFLVHTFNGTNGSSATLDWAYLPGVFESAGVRGVAGSDLFIRILPVGFTGDSQDYRVNDGIKCDTITSIGFTLVAGIPKPTATANYVTTTGYSDASNEGRVQYILCPYSMFSGVKTYYKSGLDFGHGGGGGGGGPIMDVQFIAASSTVTESSTTFPVTIQLSTLSATMIIANYSISDGTALNGTDYTGSPSGSVTFAAGQTSQTIYVDIVDDNTYEYNEEFSIYLDGVSGPYVIGTQSGHTVDLMNDELYPTFNFSSAVSNPSEMLASHMIGVNLSGPSDIPIVLSYPTNGSSTATIGTDYTLSGGGMLTFNAGETNKTITMNIINDTDTDPNEVIVLDLGLMSGDADPGSTVTHTCTIADDEP